jgi:hypothetical protein
MRLGFGCQVEVSAARLRASAFGARAGIERLATPRDVSVVPFLLDYLGCLGWRQNALQQCVVPPLHALERDGAKSMRLLRGQHGEARTVRETASGDTGEVLEEPLLIVENAGG